ncbi:Cro/CI family transcriptional regulator [Nitrosococcus wardiae]|uniref:Cro/Cl family transcriptional regulator n=1 Tax=Nitrosococcus wardiae TaxID=1814290 RepID=A0A4P7C0A7_9GAMM|nr:Cro/CI family transcriptional regulator [Nitrosococcus wardiae]QBQ54940.1 hypothetical protein E3U44_10745 [Nitrosococcus wardiae]
MTKSEAIKMFGSVGELAAALKITRHAIYQWPEKIKEPRASQIKLIALQRANPGLFSGSENKTYQHPKEDPAA